ncbi:ICEBs1 excisionase [Caproicibacterium sp. BJN0003]|uniref:ICEBs1 excisionase n=1 Tax=Caproicibacterium sp. BJN0003 TaxID=2994078 RepID=UPI0022511962|nr:ICEBs1 excisionase [Caproicibacterium sp. BJN0003]UZT81254.1 ICEBs1 excisionase [Caproicibacterium sp. BJN0003]
MQDYYIKAPEAAAILRLSEGKTYEIFRDLNKELKSQGFVTVAGRVPRAYFNKKFFGGLEEVS